MGNAFAASQLGTGVGASKADSPEPGEGSGAKVAGAAGMPTTKDAAVARYKQNQAKMDRIIQSGLSLDVDPNAPADNRLLLYRNSAQWIDQGQAAMYILSPTHDSATRVGVPAGQTAYFDNRVAYKGSGADYDDTTKDATGNPTNNAGLSIEFSSVVGTMSGDGKSLTMIDPLSHSEGFVVETLIHETQHDADQHKAGDPWAVDAAPPAPGVTEKAPATMYNSFQSEFRAYWIENPEGSGPHDQYGSSTDPATNFTIKAISSTGADNVEQTADDTVLSVTTGFSNARQEGIARQLGADGRAAGDWYDYTNKSWRQSYAQYWYYYAVDSAFKGMVDAYTKPVGGNPINSVRIQVLSDAIHKGDTAAMWTAVGNLDAADLNYLKDAGGSKPFWDQAALELDFVDYTMLTMNLGLAAPTPAKAQTVTVVKGDTLSSLADRLLYDQSRWREIYDLNKSVIGKDPNRIEPGHVLKLPAP